MLEKHWLFQAIANVNSIILIVCYEYLKQLALLHAWNTLITKVKHSYLKQKHSWQFQSFWVYLRESPIIFVKPVPINPICFQNTTVENRLIAVASNESVWLETVIPQFGLDYGDVIMATIASQITSLTIVYSTVYSDGDQRKHQSSASLAFVWGNHRDRWIPRTNGQ